MIHTSMEVCVCVIHQKTYSMRFEAFSHSLRLIRLLGTLGVHVLWNQRLSWDC